MRTRTVGARVTLPALSGVLLDASDGKLTCQATDPGLDARRVVALVVLRFCR